MGYFNFYMIKRILKNKKVRKILFSFILFIVFIILKNKVFAVSFEYNGTSFDLPDFPRTYNHNIVYASVNGAGYTVFNWLGSNEELCLYEQYSGYFKFCVYATSNNPATWSEASVRADEDVWSVSVNNITSTIPQNRSSSYATIDDALNVLCFSSSNFFVRYRNGTSNPIYTPISDFPYFLNDEVSLAEGGQSIVIMPADFTNTMQIRFAIQSITEENGIISYNNLFRLVLDNQSDFYVAPGGYEGFYYSVPWSFISQYLEISKKYNYVLAYDVNGQTQTKEIVVTYGGKTPENAIYNQQLKQNDQLQEQTNAINNQTQKIEEQTNAINNQTQKIEEQTQSIDNINNSMLDSSVESGAEDLPSTDVQNPSQIGIDNIFQSIYNAFCTGVAQDIVFPIPFTNKNITLSPYYVRDMLNNNGASWVYLLIQAFWGYLIGRFIVKDISHKITKIKGGDIENIENNNIKEEML